MSHTSYVRITQPHFCDFHSSTNVTMPDCASCYTGVSAANMHQTNPTFTMPQFLMQPALISSPQGRRRLIKIYSGLGSQRMAAGPTLASAGLSCPYTVAACEPACVCTIILISLMHIAVNSPGPAAAAAVLGERVIYISHIPPKKVEYG